MLGSVSVSQGCCQQQQQFKCQICCTGLIVPAGHVLQFPCSIKDHQQYFRPQIPLVDFSHELVCPVFGQKFSTTYALLELAEAPTRILGPGDSSFSLLNCQVCPHWALLRCAQALCLSLWLAAIFTHFKPSCQLINVSWQQIHF